MDENLCLHITFEGLHRLRQLYLADEVLKDDEHFLYGKIMIDDFEEELVLQPNNQTLFIVFFCERKDHKDLPPRLITFHTKQLLRFC